METTKKKSSIELKDTAKQLLYGIYPIAITVYVIIDLIIGLPLQLIQKMVDLNTIAGYSIYMIAYLITVLLAAVFTLGQNYFYLNIIRFRQYQFSDMWYGFKNHADKAIWANLLIILKGLACAIPFFLMLCIAISSRNYYIVPLVALTFCAFMVAVTYINLTYSQVFYLMLDYPNESAKELLIRSARLMQGNKLRLLYLQVSFLGMLMLGILSFGIGLFWVMPYMNMTKALFYENIKE